MSSQDDVLEFSKLIEHFQEKDFKAESGAGRTNSLVATAAPETSERKQEAGQPTQWELYGPGYRPTLKTVPHLPPGTYNISADQYGTFCVPVLPRVNKILELPEMRSEEVIRLVENFWNAEKDYKDGNEFVHGEAPYRCGVMLFGPPGSGKTSTLKLVSDKLVARGGTVFYADLSPGYATNFLTSFRRIEPDRKCIVILEDIDTLIEAYGESNYLQLLDGAKSIENCMFIATTNYPERLDPRIYNRPGRLAHVVKIGLPSVEARRAFLKALLKKQDDVEKIVDLTKGFSVDHLSALISGVYREKKDLDSEIERLRTLFRVPKSGEEKAIGFGG